MQWFLEAEASLTSVNKLRKWNTTHLKPKGYDMSFYKNICIFRERVMQTQATKETNFQDRLWEAADNLVTVNELWRLTTKYM